MEGQERPSWDPLRAISGLLGGRGRSWGGRHVRQKSEGMLRYIFPAVGLCLDRSWRLLAALGRSWPILAERRHKILDSCSDCRGKLREHIGLLIHDDARPRNNKFSDTLIIHQNLAVDEKENGRTENRRTDTLGQGRQTPGGTKLMNQPRPV